MLAVAFWSGGSFRHTEPLPAHPASTRERTPPLLLGEFGEIPVKSITIWPISSSPRIACQNPVRRRAPPTVHNEQSSCRDIASL